MRGWAERQLIRMGARMAPGLRLVQPLLQDPSITRDLTGEALIPRRGNWGARTGRTPPPEPAGHSGEGGAGPDLPAQRVRWNLTG